MQIQLKQVEIVNALKQYITKQGIDLAGKEVAISFTAGRKDSGLSADISITNSGIPGLVGDAEEVVKPVLSVVKVASTPTAVEKVELAQAALVAAAVQTPPTPEKSETSAKSLFS